MTRQRPPLLHLRAALVAAVAAAGCASSPDPGQWGQLQYFGNVPGEPPLPMLPPASDRKGNLYVGYGKPDDSVVKTFVGLAAGGWHLCTVTKGDGIGLRGWVGYAESREWYWSGHALVSMSGETGACAEVLDRDPDNGASLEFRAIVPWVRDTPSRTTLVAWVIAPGFDNVPSQVVVDLNSEIIENATPFTPSDATEVTVLGVGADRTAQEGVIVVRYKRADTVHAEARFLDAQAGTIAKVGIPDATSLPDGAVLGYLQANDTGLVAGLLSTGELLLLDHSGGRRVAVNSMTPVGVHRWEGALWLVGTDNGKPAIAPLDDSGSLGRPQSWSASTAAIAGLRGDKDVVNSVELPRTTVTWRSLANAVGDFPFLSPHSLDHYAAATTLWLATGPSYTFEGEPQSRVAVAPVGVTYP